MAAHPASESTVLQRICDVLAHTDNGLTGSPIGGLLSQLGIDLESEHREHADRQYRF